MGSARRKHEKLVTGVVRSTISDTPIWRFDNLDKVGKFSFDLSRTDFSHKEILQKLIDYGNMKWQEIDRQTHDRGKSKHHYISINSVSAEALERIRAKHIEEDSDALYSFAFQNTLRLIGIRDSAEFHIIWYDPNHEFCPSSKS